MFYVAVRNSRHLVATRVTAIVIGLCRMSGLLAMFESVKPSDTFPKAWGGLMGQLIYQRLLADALGPFGTGLLLGTVYCFALLFVITKDIGSEIEKIIGNFYQWRADRAQKKAALKEERAKRKEEMAKQRSAVMAAAARPRSCRFRGPLGARKMVLPKSRRTRSQVPSPTPAREGPPEDEPKPAPARRSRRRRSRSRS